MLDYIISIVQNQNPYYNIITIVFNFNPIIKTKKKYIQNRLTKIYRY